MFFEFERNVWLDGLRPLSCMLDGTTSFARKWNEIIRESAVFYCVHTSVQRPKTIENSTHLCPMTFGIVASEDGSVVVVAK